MSTLDVTCGRCSKSFRVRAEFAGKSTRCPGCSAPLAIGQSSRPVAPPPEEDRPRPKPRREENEDRPRTRHDWRGVESAVGREQTALTFCLIEVAAALVSACLANISGPGSPFVTLIIVVLTLGPTLTAAAFGVAARVAALRVPPDSLVRTSAIASLICSIVALGCIVFAGFAFLLSIESNTSRNEPLIVVAIGGLIVSSLGSLATFAGFTAQVGMFLRSEEISRSVGRAATAATVCVVGLVAIGGLMSLAAMASRPSYGPYGYYNDGRDMIYRGIVIIMLPLAIVVMLVMYHRLLAATKRAVRE